MFHFCVCLDLNKTVIKPFTSISLLSLIEDILANENGLKWIEIFFSEFGFNWIQVDSIRFNWIEKLYFLFKILNWTVFTICVVLDRKS